MAEPDLFKEAQEQDKDGIAVPILQRMLEHPDFADAACLLRGMISGMQWRLADLQTKLAESETAGSMWHDHYQSLLNERDTLCTQLAQAQNLIKSALAIYEQSVPKEMIYSELNPVASWVGKARDFLK